MTWHAEILRQAARAALLSSLILVGWPSATVEAQADAGAGDASPPSGDGAVSNPIAVPNGTVPSGTVTNGTVPSGTVTNGTVNAASTDIPVNSDDVAVEGDAVPWAAARDVADGTEVPLPSFLDTTDRRVQDERPPPSPEQVAALREMQAEVERYVSVGNAYRDTVVAIVRREYLRQRRERGRWYAGQIREEERLQNEARERAIQLFERFLRRYPDDPRYSPDAMFRLGELYFERSAIQFQEEYDAAMEAADRGEDVIPPDTANFEPTIELYQRLVRLFPDYRRIDGVYYLIGYCLSEMGRIEEARMAWLNLVCANEYNYNPDAPAPPHPADPPANETTHDGEDGEHPALGLDGEEEPAPAVPAFTNPYEACRPVVEGARFVSETWFRIGEYHFDDYGDPNALELAVSAYGRILTDPEDRNYSLALYKVAWTYYRASRYRDAIRTFGMLVTWSDQQRERTGRAGSELRPEAIQYLGISFAYDDWNENQVPDTVEGLPDGITRIQDPDILPQDRSWTPEVYFQLGQVYFDEARYPEAIRVWRLALERWPMHFRAPEITNLVARAHQLHNEQEQYFQALAELAEFGPGTPWYNSNTERPTELREAEQLAEGALIRTALRQHQMAQRLRRQCIEQRDPSLCTEAQSMYAAAAEAYRQYLLRYPNDPQAYELRYNLADALYWSENYEQAAVEYAAVRDSNLDDTHLAESARRVVESLSRILEAARERGAVSVRETPPVPAGEPASVRPIAMPQLVQRLAQGRELYIARVSDEADSEDVREAYDFNNAVLLYRYGYWEHARERFARIFDERCSGPNADETGEVAWQSLRQMAVALQQDEEIESLANQLRERSCTFQAGATEPVDIDCSAPENENRSQCLVISDLNGIRYRRALDIYRRAEESSGEEQVRLYEEAATILVEAVNRNPEDTQAPLALEYAANALERTSRFESAATLYQRIIDEVGPREARSDEEQVSLDAILANAYFRLAYNANRFFDFDRAVENYRVLADSPRFQSSTADGIREKREDALINAALIYESLQQYTQAADYYRRAAETMEDQEARIRAYYRIAEMAYTRQDWAATVREMRGFINNPISRNAGELVVQAYWRIAEATQRTRREDDYYRALADVVSAFGRSGQEPGSLAAEYAGEAAFLIADRGMEDFEQIRVQTPRRPATLDVYVQEMVRELERVGGLAVSRSEAYVGVRGYRRPAWTIASLTRQGRVEEVTVRAILNTEFTVPEDLRRQIRGLEDWEQEEIAMQVEDRIRELLDARVRPLECRAISRYALASRAALVASLDNEYTQQAIDRLQAYGEERVAECVTEAAASDPGFAPYQPGEFTRAPRGQNVPLRSRIAPPPLAGGAE